MTNLTKIAIIVGTKGRGSNMRNLIEHFQTDPDIHVTLVLAPSPDSPALEVANKFGVKTATFNAKDDKLPQKLAQKLSENNINFICLAGYLRLIPSNIVKEFTGRILNIHPALLPKFGGKGMYGMHVHNAVIEAKETESGCTIHYVNEEYDEGAILLQSKCEITPHDTPESLAQKVLKLEHETYPKAVKLALAKLSES